MNPDVMARLTQVIRDVLGDPGLGVTPELTAADVDGWDSVTQVELIYAVEEEFDITFSADEITAHPDVGALCRDVEGKLSGG